jgi:integrase
MAVKANELAIKALHPRAEPYETAIRDHRGLTVRVHPSGERVFRLRYRQDGVLKRIRLDAATFAQARKEWMAHSESVKVGEDPVAQVKAKRAEKQLKRQAERAAPTVAMLAGDFIELYAKRKKRSWLADERMLAAAILPEWGRIKAATIQRRDVIHLLDKIAATRPVYANRVLAVTRKMFNWAVERDILAASPGALGKPHAKEQSRERVLSDAELRAFWAGLPESGISTAVQDALRLQLLTACRIGEALGAQADEFDPANNTWLIPGARTKNGRENLLPLSQTAAALVAPLCKRGSFLFPGNGSAGHIRIDAATHELAYCALQNAMPRFTSHDLRRTAATKLAELGTSRVVLDAILNHKDRTVGAIYDRHDYAKEKRAALDAWAAHLDAIVHGKPANNVVSLRKHSPKRT